MSVHRLVLALPLCLSACGIVFDDSSGGSASDSDDSHSSAPHTTDPPDSGSSGGSSGDASSSSGDDGSSGEPVTTTSPTTGEQTTGDGGSTGDDSETTGAVNQLPPIDSADELEKWLAEGSYKGWLNESKVHMSTGPHGGNVRTYVNDDLYVSLSNMNAMHPQGAATVKELYGNGVDEIVGYAVMVKVAPDSMGGDGWYWYERLNATTYADGTGVGLCSGCHVGGADYVLTPFPLQ